MWCHAETSITLHATSSQKTSNLHSPQNRNINPAYCYKPSEHLCNLQLEIFDTRGFFFISRALIEEQRQFFTEIKIG
jgi:hypothetical protein